MGLAVVRESDGEKCRHNLNQVVRAGCTPRGNSGRNYFVDWRHVFAGDEVYKSRKINLNQEN